MAREGDCGTVPEYDPRSRVYRLSYDPDDQGEFSTVVVSAVSRVTGVPVEAIELNAVVHPEALNLLFSDRANGTPRDGGMLVFTLAGCEVTLKGNDEVVLRRSREIGNVDHEADD